MNHKDPFDRRKFLKGLGLTAISLPAAALVGKNGDSDLLASPMEYGQFMVRRLRAGHPYQVDESRYVRFDQRNEVFSRGHWDSEVMDSERPFRGTERSHIKNNDPGFTLLDYAFSNAAWTVAHGLGSGAGAIGGSNGGLYSWTPLGGGGGAAGLPPWQPSDWTPEEVAGIVKKAALFYGASLSGIAELDERWIYSHRYTKNWTDPPRIHAPIHLEDVEAPAELEDGTLVIPKSMRSVIAMAFEMDEDGIATYISGPGGAATGNGYSRMTFTAACLAEFIRGLGYHAIPSGNCTALSIPVAIDAGLGEMGRNGLLITPKYGPRVRLAKVITNMPLLADRPIKFGVTEFCEVCGKCAERCPGEAITRGERTHEPIDISNSPGIHRWPVNHPRCHLVWAQSGLDCANCIRVCPFNKPEGWLHEATRLLIGANNHSMDKIMLKLDDASGYGRQADPRSFWKKNRFVHIKE